MAFIDFIHKYMSVVDRVRSTKEWLPVKYQGGEVTIPNHDSVYWPATAQLDDNKYVYENTPGDVDAAAWAGIGLFGLIAGVIPSLSILPRILGVTGSSSHGDPLWVSLFFFLCFSAVAFLPIPAILLSFVYPFKRPKERLLIWDRENGTVTLPPRFWGEPEVVPFKDLKVKKIRNLGSFVQFHVLAAFRPSDGQPIEFGLLHNNDKDWAFYCWYMDKTRPLPPGEVFDPYRERDEERRRREMAGEGE
ncbi:hypothetical protein [Geoalkalibacter halelectricus]|uniref:Uncharacterized protein n=1 Tax=Geoalkalibacter halelectricus TaxID=2847045 RepID=A0ABY5ZLB9_9BACT|nr:hypothetical protein [Geoalkalibacter halelectricus]MDO3376530.1 hypothetical protein [Geoalkalibacter halelectricus]UWZ79644.1 hypothetical protein L9S41_18480 [Geoalkalibacter halelectricus]